MIKVTDVAYARFTAPDLDRMETFLIDFGLTRSACTADALYMRGSNAEHHLHVTHLGKQQRFLGMAFNAASLEDLEVLATAEGASAVEAIDEPGGGRRVRLTDPNGFQVETVFGIDTVPPLPVNELQGPDFGPDHRREGKLMRAQNVPCPVKRMGHVVLNVPNCELTDQFYKSHFGFLSSDVCYRPADDTELAVVFNRCDQGHAYVDHHTLLLLRSELPGLGHVSFEVEDINALFVGHEYLQSQGYEHSWGVGRHTQAGQIFDYWFDPYGHRLEHFNGGDLLNSDDVTKVAQVTDVLHSQWGAQAADRRASLTDQDPLTAT